MPEFFEVATQFAYCEGKTFPNRSWFGHGTLTEAWGTITSIPIFLFGIWCVFRVHRSGSLIFFSASLFALVGVGKKIKLLIHSFVRSFIIFALTPLNTRIDDLP